MVRPDRPQMTIWRMRIACWIPKATNAHSAYVILTAFPRQLWLLERASMLCYVYTACLVEKNDRLRRGSSKIRTALHLGYQKATQYQTSSNLSEFFCKLNKLTLRTINLLKSNGYVMHHQFNIQQLYVLPTLYLCVLYLSENKQRLVPLTA